MNKTNQIIDNFGENDEMKNWMVALLVFGSTLAQAQQWHKDLDLAVNKAAHAQKMVLLLFSLPEACERCEKLEKNVIASDEFKAYAKEYFVLAKPDFSESASIETKTDNLLIVEKYNKDGFFPWVVILDSNAKVLGKIGLYNDESPGEYIDKLKSTIRKQ